MAWTLASEVTAAWIGDDAPSNTALVDVWIGKAERRLKSKLPDLQARIDGGTEPDLLSNIKDVVTEMVQEVFRNPEGVRSTNVTTGPFSENRTYGGDKPGSLYVSADQLERLAPVGTSVGAFMVDMIPSTSPFSPNYVETL